MNGKYIFHLYAPAAHYGSKPDLYSVSTLPKEGFASLYAVSFESAQAIEQAGTAKGFKGCVWSEALTLDFDSHEAGERAGSKLEEMSLEYDAYDTGNRGFHFYIRRPIDPSHLLPLQDKAWVRENFPEADRSIYTHLHPFRLPGTIHDKTGRTKHHIHHNNGGPLLLPPFKEQELSFVSPPSEGRGARSVFDSHYLMAHTVPVFNGERHYYMIKQIYALKNLGVSVENAKWWLQEWNKLLSEPKEDAEIDKALASIYR